MKHTVLYVNFASSVVILVLSVVLVQHMEARSALYICATPGDTTSGCVTETPIPPVEHTNTPFPTYLPTYYTRVAPTATNVQPTNTARPTYLPTYYTRIAPTATNVPATSTARPTYLPTYYTRVAPTATNVPPTSTARPTYLPTYYTRVAPTATSTPVHYSYPLETLFNLSCTMSNLAVTKMENNEYRYILLLFCTVK